MKLNKKIVSLLKKKKLKISFAESCTGGLLSSAITSISGSSKVFSMGLVIYSNHAKYTILNIPKKIINKYGAVSMQCCLYMVNNLYKISKSNICISVTGVAGPLGGSQKKPVGLVYVAIKKGKMVKVNKFMFKNRGRNYIQKITVKNALNLIKNII